MRRRVNGNKATEAKCRKCAKAFFKIAGVKVFDHLCCSDACFIASGPLPVGYSSHPAPDPQLVRQMAKELGAAYTKPAKTKRKGRRAKSKYSEFYESQEWINLRYAVLRKYGRECMCCGATKGAMHVDHVKPRSRFPELQLSFDNMQVLCKACNLGKSNRYEDDFRS